MAREMKKIKLAPRSELARALKAAGHRSVLLETHGELYRIERIEKEPEDIWEGYDPEKVQEALDKYAGSWKDIDAEAFKTFIYRAREEGTRPAD